MVLNFFGAHLKFTYFFTQFSLHFLKHRKAEGDSILIMFSQVGIGDYFPTE